MSRAGLSPADLARALARLAPGDEGTRRAIAALVGIGWDEAPPAAERPERPAPPGEALPERRHPPPPPEDGRVGPPPAVELEAAAGVLDAVLPPSRLSRIASAVRTPPAWLEEVDPLARPAAEAAAPVPLEPLLRPGRERGILTVAAGTGSGEGDLDMAAVVDAIARARPLTAVPRLPFPTLARGVQLLVDRSDAMLPFLGDLGHLEEAVAAFVGREALDVVSFTGCPGRRAGKGAVRRWREYFPHSVPPRGTRVLCVTDLGIGTPKSSDPPAGVAEWLDFAARLVSAGTPLLVVTPYPPARWPPELARALSILHWSRATTAGDAARAGRGRSPVAGRRGVSR